MSGAENFRGIQRRADGAVKARLDWQTIVESDNLFGLYGWTGAGVYVNERELVMVPRLTERFVAFALTMHPERCIGIGIGPDGEVHEFHPLENHADDPTRELRVSAEDIERINELACAKQWQITLLVNGRVMSDESATSYSYEGLTSVWPDAARVTLTKRDDGVELKAFRAASSDGGELLMREAQLND